MIDCRFKPIEKWPSKPTPSHDRKNLFSAPWEKTLRLLESELTKIRARDITIEGFFFQDDIRNDGWPRSAARPTQPGVILRFVTKKGVMEFACDRFTHWQKNVRAIALGLEALRKIDKYGITSEEEQYSGWLRLPVASPVDEATECAKILIEHASVNYAPSQILGDSNVFDEVWRVAVKRTHPDTGVGGNGADFNRVITARERIKTLKGWR
jgi:hypothetical protein